jgi:hypothetical protein
VAALRKLTFQGIAYARPVQWTEKGDNKVCRDLHQRG